MSEKQKQPTAHKIAPVFVVNVDEAKGIVEAIVNVSGVIDDGNDIVVYGAFTKTIADSHAQRVKVLDQHRTDSILRVIGKTIQMREVGRSELPAEVLMQYPEATGGLWTQTQYLLNTPEGKGAFERISSGAVDEYSIGYDALQVEYVQTKRRDGSPVKARLLKEIRLWEYSPVVWGMNPATATVMVKSGDGIETDPADDALEGDTLPIDAKEAKASSIGVALQSMVVQDVSGRGWLDKELITLDEYALLQTALVEAARTVIAMLPADLLARELPAPVYDDWGWMSSAGADGEKAGRVLADRNAQKVVAARDALNEVITDAKLNEENANTPDESAGRDAERETEAASSAGAEPESITPLTQAKAGAEPGFDPLTLKVEIEREELELAALA